MNFAIISKIIFTTSKFYEPNLTTFFSYKKISEKEMMDIIIDKLIDECKKGNFDLIKNKDKKELITDNSNKIKIQEIYNKHFKVNNTELSLITI